ncbi:TPA: tail fiber assembly protein [Enterobacter hormaechei subsp. steigerwaltii]|nr:tail fiber assembly protein [Enterobacter hormaechei subsp. steigerwaltii]
MNYLYSPSKNAFYAVSLREAYIKAGSLPDDVLSVDDGIYKEYSNLAPSGKIRVSGSDGFPTWGDAPPPTEDEIIASADAKKSQLRASADAEIEWRQDAVDVGIATEEESAVLADWKKYRVLLMRVDTAAPEWPTSPAETAS